MDKKVVVLHYSYKKHSTMKNIRIYALLALLLMAGGVTAQKSDIVFAPLGAEWHYNYYGMFEEGYVNIKATKDTIIDGMYSSLFFKITILTNNTIIEIIAPIKNARSET